MTTIKIKMKRRREHPSRYRSVFALWINLAIIGSVVVSAKKEENVPEDDNQITLPPSTAPTIPKSTASFNLNLGITVPTTGAPTLSVAPSPEAGIVDTPAPITPAPTTPAPITFEPTTSEPITPEPTTPAPVTSAPITAEPTTSEPSSASPTDAPSTLKPTKEPTTARPTPPPTSPRPTPLLGPNDINCHEPNLEKQACKDALNCEWGQNEENGEQACDFIFTSSVAPSPSATFGTASITNTANDDIVVVVENCYTLSMNQQQCTSASNCEWTIDQVGTTLCAVRPIIAENCYVLSVNEVECVVASNCEWGLDTLGLTYCKEIQGFNTPSGSATPFPTDPTVAGGGQSLINDGGVDCVDPNLSKESCKTALTCEWDKNLNICLALSASPTLPPTLRPNTLNPTPFPTNTPKPTRIGHVNCHDPDLSRSDCKVALNCVWVDNADEDGRNECEFGTWSPTMRPVMVTLSPTSMSPTSERPTLGPSVDPTKYPALRPTTVEPTPEPHTTIPPTLSPTPFPSTSPFSISTSELEDLVDCLDPKASKEDCKNARNCEWNKFQSECLAISLSPTITPSKNPSTSPTLLDCDDANTSKNDCKDAIHCAWDEEVEVCRFITILPTESPSDSPSKRPTPEPTTAEPTVGTPRPTKTSSATPLDSPTASPSATPTTSFPPTVMSSFPPSKSSSPTISSKPTASPTISHFPTMGGYEYVRPKRNDLRYVPWSELARDLQVTATDNLRYTKETWDNLGSNPIEHLRWDDLSQKQQDAALELGFDDEVSWNCWINHWESFSWKQLYTLKLTPYLTSLGWDLNSWNRQYRETPVVRKQDWDGLTGEQRRNATQLCYYKTSYDRLDVNQYGYGYPMKKPVKRFVQWKDVENMVKTQLEQSLEYTELTWNVLRLADIEQKGWFEFMYYERDTAAVLGLDEASWDCWINHYDSYGWSDLVKKGLHRHYIGLGWTEAAWNEEVDPPANDGLTWNELNETEQLIATELCYYQENWDRIDMTSNDGPFPFPKPQLRYKVWEELTADQKRVAQNVLLYEESTWNDVGLADIEKRAWDDLTEYQKPYVIELGMYQRTWDCFQNHYRATKWDGLSEEVLSAATVLGWDQGKWSRWASEPSSYGTKWSLLSQDEKSAAYVMCHFDVTWPGDGSSITLLNQNDYNDNIVSGASQLAVSTVLATVVMALFSSHVL